MGLQTSCGDCKLVETEWWIGKKFGRLSILCPIKTKLGSEQKVDWICGCGNIHNTAIQSVISGKTKSCGSCSLKAKIWYYSNKDYIRSLKYPITPLSISSGGPVFIDPFLKSMEPTKSMCFICKNLYYPRWGDIRKGVSLTCGCSTNRISSGHLAVSEYVKSLGFSIENEYKLGKYKYDIYVVEKNLLIEFNGDKWHSSEKVKKRDSVKLNVAIENNYKLIFISEHDWNKRKDDVKSMLNGIINI